MRGSRLLRARTHQRAIVTLTTGETFDGLLMAHDDLILQLGNAEAVAQSDMQTMRTPVDGLLSLQWSRIAYVQHP